MQRILLARAAILVLFFVSGTISLATHAQASSQATLPTSPPDWRTAAGNKLAFDVATVNPNPSDDTPTVNFILGPGDAYRETGGRFLTSNISLLDYIHFAYKLTDGQVEIMQASAPNWIATKRFDIQAKSEAPNPTKDQMRLMMQSLLAERFNLLVHSETRELPILALVLAKPGRLGPQLQPHSPDGTACSTVAAPANQASPALPVVCGGLASVGVPSAPSHIRIGGRAVSLALLAAHLGQMGHYNRPIIDQTGLSGTFDLVLEWGPDQAADSPNAPIHDDEQSILQEALKDQLGLKLERRKAPTPVFLIDRLNPQPTAN